jgi:uncharacterized protein YjcR
MTLSVKEQTAVSRLRKQFAKNTQSTIADTLGVSPSQVAAWKAVMKAINVEVPDSKFARAGRPTKIKSLGAPVIAAKATRKRTNGLHAH